jgi:ubiquinone/menaquinone biosynthesis C-methylase UbiE
MRDGHKPRSCRSCGAPLTTLFADLGVLPISNAFPSSEGALAGEKFYPLRAFACSACWLVQIEDIATSPETHFHRDYPYFSSYSSSWIDHARQYAEMAITRLNLEPGSRIVEIASNDGYLLRHFVNRAGIASLGVDPAAKCALAASAHGVDTRVAFFSKTLATDLAKEGWCADLVIANNVLAHVPDLNDFVAGMAIVLKSDGTATLEFPHLLSLIENVAFDTIYHEHYSYLSLLALKPLFARHGLLIYDVEKLATHGGSLRLFVAHVSDQRRSPSVALDAIAAEERAFGLADLRTYAAFSERVSAHKRALLKLLIGLKETGARICGYGAPAKGTILLNYCGIRRDLVDFTVDRNPEKQGRSIPGTGIPILDPEEIARRKPNYVLILPWNLSDEIIQEWTRINEWGGRFIVPTPVPRVIG